MIIPDNYSMWEQHEARQQRELERLPICADCGEAVQDSHFYLINDEVVCPDCLEAGYKRRTDDFVQ